MYRLIIQLIYIKRSENDSVNQIVYITLLFTMLSLIHAFLGQFSRFCQSLRVRRNKFLKRDVLICQLNMKCEGIRQYHHCTHSTLEMCINSVLKTSKELSELNYRLDTSYEIEVYNVSVHTALKTMSSMFECNIYSNEMHQHESKKSMREIIIDNIKDINSTSSINHQHMKQSIAKYFKLDVKKIKSLELVIVRSQRFDENIENVNVVV